MLIPAVTTTIFLMQSLLTEKRRNLLGLFRRLGLLESA